MDKTKPKRVSSRFQNLTKKKFGRWRVVKRGPNSACGKTRWHCICKCKTKKLVFASHLTSGLSLSCGCKRIESITKHGRSRTPEYDIWEHIVSRCENTADPAYPEYGGAGIILHEPWRASFAAFFNYVGLRPSRQHSIDRFPDNSGSYVPGNVRWATPKEQARNRSSNVLLTLHGNTACIAEWAEKLGISRITLGSRLHAGWSVERTLTTPIKCKGKKS